jgi:hypothetical protein
MTTRARPGSNFNLISFRVVGPEIISVSQTEVIVTLNVSDVGTPAGRGI